MIASLQNASRIVLEAYASVFFLRSAFAGLVIFAVSLSSLESGVSGILAAMTAVAMLKLLGLRLDDRIDLACLYNPILVGLTIGFFYGLNVAAVALTLVAAAFTLLATRYLAEVLGQWGLPVLSLPFSLIGIGVLLAGPTMGGLVAAQYYHIVPNEIKQGLSVNFLRSLGIILYSPHVATGLLVLGIMTFYSRILVFLAVLGFLAGSSLEYLLADGMSTKNALFHSFNYMLTAMALGGGFLAPGWRSFLLAIIGVAMTALLAFALRGVLGIYHVPVLALPFNIIAILVLRNLKQIDHDLVMTQTAATPEAGLSQHLLGYQRFGGREMAVALPFKGLWQVYQGFDGPWTHKGDWQHALDFVRTYSDGRTYKNSGAELADYGAFDEPIYAPVAGYVVALESQQPDNPIGFVNKTSNWGNYIIIQTLAGGFVELSHLKQHSLKVSHGAWVEPGQEIARCGNSGYSPEPHIHLQVQQGPHPGDFTVPFHLTSWHLGGRLKLHQIPEQGALLEPVVGNLCLLNAFSFSLDQTLCFEVTHSSSTGTIVKDELELKVLMERVSGQFYFSDQYGNTIHFSMSGGLFQFTSYKGKRASLLSMIYAAMPTIPLHYNQPLSWQTALPMDVCYGGWNLLWRSFVACFWRRAANGTGAYQSNASGTEIVGEVMFANAKRSTAVTIDPQLGWAALRCGDVQFKRKDNIAEGGYDEVYTRVA